LGLQRDAAVSKSPIQVYSHDEYGESRGFACIVDGMLHDFDLSAVRTESDVEHKIIWPLLTSGSPLGFGLTSPDVLTKVNIRRLEIGKGTTRKIYFPDYVVVIAGLPLLVIEAKAPHESLEVGLDEARLYGNELNAQFAPTINPCFRVIACNGAELWSCPIDSGTPDFKLALSELVPTHKHFAELLRQCSRASLQDRADAIRRKLRKSTYQRPVSEVGGQSFQNEELPQNTFGATIAGDYGHIFNPKTREDRAKIVRHAYVPSLRQQRYIELAGG
jgi:hypothetical protein